MSRWYVKSAHVSGNLIVQFCIRGGLYRHMQGRGRSTTWLPGDDHTQYLTLAPNSAATVAQPRECSGAGC